MKKERIRSLTFISLCVAIMAVLSQIAIPTGAVPITLQVFVVALIGYFLGAKNGLIAITVYILLGLVGVPVFASFQGGLHTLISYTGGFIFGYIPFVLLCGIKGSAPTCLVLGGCGLLACHLSGAVQYACLSGLGLCGAVLVVSVPFLLKDALLVVAAYYVSRIMKKRIK